ncbi:hypothetical protein [Undibacterium sp. Di24W]|uniref:hypothetical protein n=1 Tax=Undibacterium sp. Di24W TaxID=3413033 RepID=UPI003BF379C5
MYNKLINHLPSGTLSFDVDQLFTDFDYLGLFKKYGSCCLFINSLLCRALRKKQYQAELIVCYAKLEDEQRTILLGHPNYIAPGQLAGHVFCLVDNQYLIDFGLGNLRKFDPYFAQAVACTTSEDASYIASTTTSSQKKLTWLGNHTIPDLKIAIHAQESGVVKAMSSIEKFQSDRLGHCVRKTLNPMHRQSGTSIISTQSNNWPLKNFDDTLQP